MTTREAALEAALRAVLSEHMAHHNLMSHAAARAALALPPDNRVERLCEALSEVSDDCAAWVGSAYLNHESYPMETRRYNRDMGPVNRARALLAMEKTDAK